MWGIEAKNTAKCNQGAGIGGNGNKMITLQGKQNKYMKSLIKTRKHNMALRTSQSEFSLLYFRYV